MSINETISEFAGVAKGPTRAFRESKCNGFTLYSLPNGISIFKLKTELKEGAFYSHTDLDLGIGFDFEVIENKEEYVIIKKILKKNKKPVA